MDIAHNEDQPSSPVSEKREESLGVKSPTKKSRAGLGWSIIIGIILIILVLVVLDRVVGVNIFTTSEERQRAEVAQFLEETGAWHAVFLTNGQVYFGQLENPEAQYVTLRDIYYLQVQQPIQPPASQGNATSTGVIAAPPQPRLTLIKFGTELHRPQDFMKINRDHILFWEELSAESQVVQAIQRYKKGQ